MGILKKILHPITAIEKWALERILKNVAQSIPKVKAKIPEIWNEHKDEIIQKVTSAIKQTVLKVVKKALEKQGITILDNTNN